MADGQVQPPPPPHEGVEKHLLPTGEESKHPATTPLNPIPPFDPTLIPLTYAAAASSPPTSPPTFPCITTNLRPTALHEGKPSVIFKGSDRSLFISKMKHVVVGKFSHGRPQLSAIKAFLTNLKLKGEYSFSIYDHRHIFIECDHLEDRNKIWLKHCWFINSTPMRVFKWTPEFTPSMESLIRPVWVSFPGLPLYLFDEFALSSIANTIGVPIRYDSYTANRVKLGVATVCVELDLSKPRPSETWVVFEDEENPEASISFWQSIEYENIPPFCTSCSHMGHTITSCKVLNALIAEGKTAILTQVKTKTGQEVERKDYRNSPRFPGKQKQAYVIKAPTTPSAAGCSHSSVIPACNPPLAPKVLFGPSVAPDIHIPPPILLSNPFNALTSTEQESGEIFPVGGNMQLLPPCYQESLGDLCHNNKPSSAPNSPAPLVADWDGTTFAACLDMENKMGALPHE
ncbi:hypothetical protein LIER_37406 [Lithospermum erythrorhizon]|uniref:DUF4283 domain-containing protein n=1 Tax=Lithospermum erythrorhizon TaxID=34254 RepID=A0AAV3PL66_LITER